MDFSTPSDTSTATTNPHGPYNNMNEFGSWDSSWPSFLGSLLFTTAFCVFIALWLIGFGKEAFKSI